MAIFFKDPRHKKIGIPQTAAIISVNGSHNGTVPDVTLYNPQKANLKSSSFAGTTSKPTILLTPYQKQSFTYPIKVEPGTTKVNIEQQLLLVKPRSGPSLKQRIPRPPNAFMLFAHDFRRQVAYEYPKESNKDISIRLGIMWKNLPKPERERYFRSAKEVDAAHKQKYPDYVYNPKEARMRKALREQIRGERYQAGLPQVKWVKQSCVMNQQQSPIMLARQPYRSDNNKSVHLREQVERDARMLQNLPDYLDLSYPGLNIPTNQNEYPSAEGQPWCQYMQNSMQPNAGYLRNNEVKMPTSWSLSSDYNSDQNNYIQTSPRGSPYSHTNQQTANSLLINGNHQPTEEEAAVASICLPIETKVENNLSLSNENQPQVHLTDLYRTAECKGIDEYNDIETMLPSDNCIVSPASNSFVPSHISWSSFLYTSPKKKTKYSMPFQQQNDSHQDLVIPDYIDYGLIPENSPVKQELDPLSSINFIKQNELDKFGMDYPNLYFDLNNSLDIQNYILPTKLDDFQFNPKPGLIITKSKNECDHKFHNLMTSEEFAQQDLSRISSLNQPPVIISQNDKICVVLESSGIDSEVKEFTSL
uniref:Sex-determining region Y protein n=1 Tax=Clastoptera arizonana TaxID=38151 RepID=A0A1B6C7J8_9HEMI